MLTAYFANFSNSELCIMVLYAVLGSILFGMYTGVITSNTNISFIFLFKSLLLLPATKPTMESVRSHSAKVIAGKMNGLWKEVLDF